MDAKQDKVSSWQHFENEVAVVGRVVSDLPGAIWHGLSEDVKANPVKRSVEALGTAAVAAAVYVGARRAPIITRDVSYVGGAGSGVAATLPLWNEAGKFLDGTRQLLSDGWNASDSASREKLGQTYANAIGKDVAPAAELSVAAAVGAVSGHALLSNDRANRWLSSNLTERAEYSWRSRAFGAESYLFKKAGSFTSPHSFLNEDGTANLLNVDKAIDGGPRTLLNRALRQVDPHIEESRVIDLNKDRISAPMRGTDTSTQFGFKPQSMTYHTHPEFYGARPSLEDVTAFKGVHMIKSGDDIAVYLGVRGQYAGIQKGANLDEVFAERGVPTLKALIVNPKAGIARIIDGAAVRNPLADSSAPLSQAWHWGETVPEFVDFKAASAFLKRVPVNEPEVVETHFNLLRWMPAKETPDVYQLMRDLRQLGGRKVAPSFFGSLDK